MPYRFIRKKLMVDLPTQGPFMVKVALIWAGGMLLLCALLYYLADEELGRNFYSIHQRIRNTWQILLPAVAISGGISFLVTIAFTVVFALRESHRIGGPVYKFGRLFHELEQGNLDPSFHFRKGDLLFALGESYRAALDSHGRRIAAVQESLRLADETMGELRILIHSRAVPAEEQEVLEEAARRLESAREQVAVFRTTGPKP